MRIRITIKRDKEVLHSVECDIAAEGEIEQKVASALVEARKKERFGAQWGFTIHVDKA